MTHVKPQAVAYIDDRGVPFSSITRGWESVRLAVEELANRLLPPKEDG